jgi:hypothetical protein
MRIRVLVVTMTRLTTDIVVAGLSDAPELDLVGVVPARRAAAEAARADVVVVPAGADDAIPPLAEELLLLYPRLTVVGISPDACRAGVYDLVPRSRCLSDVSTAGIVNALVRALDGRAT